MFLMFLKSQILIINSITVREKNQHFSKVLLLAKFAPYAHFVVETFVALGTFVALKTFVALMGISHKRDECYQFGV